MELMKQIIARAKEDKQRIVLPEGTEPRTLTAADKLIKDGVACPILLGNKTEILSLAKELGLANIENAEIINPAESDKRASYVDLLVELRKSKGLTREEAEELVNNPLYYGCLMVKAHDADGFVAGAINYTKDVLRPALQIIKTKPGIKCVSGAFLLFTKSQYGDNGFVLVADVCSNYFGFIVIQSGYFAGTTAYIAVAGAVEAIFADAVFGAIVVGKCIAIDILRHGLLKSGIEYTYLRSLG